MFDFDLFAILFQYRGIDGNFTAVRIATLITFVPWPLVAFIGIMAFAGKPLFKGTRFGELFSEALYLLVICYPLIFMLTIEFAERILAPRAYALGFIVGLLPLALVALCLWWIFRNRSATAATAQGDDGRAE